MTEAEARAILSARYGAFEKARKVCAVPAFASPAAPGFVFYPAEGRVARVRCQCDRIARHRVVDEGCPNAALLGFLAWHLYQGKALAHAAGFLVLDLSLMLSPAEAREIALGLRAGGAAMVPEDQALASELEDAALELDRWAQS